MKRNIFIMYAIALMQGMVFYGPVATLYRQVRGVSLFEITIIESICLGLCILLEIPWGIVADKIGYKKTMIFSVLIGDNYFALGGFTVISYGFAAFLSFFLVEIKPRKVRRFVLNEFKFLLKSTFENKNLLFLLISIAFLSEAHQSVTVFLGQVKYSVIGLSPNGMGYVFILVSLAGLLGGISHWFVKIIGQRLSAFLLFAGGAVACAVLAWFCF